MHRGMPQQLTPLQRQHALNALLPWMSAELAAWGNPATATTRHSVHRRLCEQSHERTLELRYACREATREYRGSESPTAKRRARQAHISRRTWGLHSSASIISSLMKKNLQPAGPCPCAGLLPPVPVPAVQHTYGIQKGCTC